MPHPPYKVLVVDDSAIVRKVPIQLLSADPQIEVVGAAPDPYVARQMIAELRPDVLTLDMEMPRMDGLTFLRKLMEHFPVPTVVLSSLTGSGTEMAVEALQAGAVEVLAKPAGAFTLRNLAGDLPEAVKSAAQANVSKILSTGSSKRRLSMTATTDKIVAIGASTGGTKAIERILTELPATAPGMLISQHMPEAFTRTFADRLNQICAVSVQEAETGMTIRPGRVLIAPGSHHLELRRDGAQYVTALSDGPPVNRHRPSVDVLFESVSKFAGRNAIGVLLTGMGKDGAKGLLTMKEAGAETLAQDESTSVVFGMPKEAIKLGAAERVVPLNEIAEQILNLATAKSAGHSSCTEREYAHV